MNFISGVGKGARKHFELNIINFVFAILLLLMIYMRYYLLKHMLFLSVFYYF